MLGVNVMFNHPVNAINLFDFSLSHFVIISSFGLAKLGLTFVDLHLHLLHLVHQINHANPCKIPCLAHLEAHT
jgi:hypothetical protein